ncbi:EAL domain-containing protein [Solibacillus sp. FSL R7-0682]|uniref:EAL domain-containing protein n=1 Tax=Solibacillus sp. FSL R7-0682 TaxID=2921690 RepID=UPI0030F72E7E
MLFIFFSLLAIIPFCVGIIILVLFKRNRLSKSIFLFLLFASFWQIDVSVLYSHGILQEETILTMFQLFRFGFIMVTPAIVYIGYIIVQEMLPEKERKKWRFIVNRTTVILSFVLALVAYIIGWSDKGVSGLQLIQSGTNLFYFPIDGELSWVITANLILFIASIVICFFITLDVHDKCERSFILYFNIFTSIGFAIGLFNMFPSSNLVTSSIAILVFAISILIISIQMHISIIHNMNKELVEQKKFLCEIINLNPNYIYAQDEEGRYTLINESYAQLMDTTIQQMLGKTDVEIQLAENNADNQLKAPSRLLEKKVVKEESMTTASGEIVWLQTVKVPIQINEQKTLLTVSTDITERKQHEDEIKYQAYHDALTGLPNRRMFNEDLTSFLEKAKADSTEVAIIFLDLDRFKYINDTLGHDVGDLLLIEVSSRMKSFLDSNHPSAKIYRLGGDEFTIILPNYSTTKSEAFAKELLAQYVDSILVDGMENFISPSIGISIYPNDGEDVRTLIKHADTAMYYVKARGKSNYQLFTVEMQQQFYRKMIIENQLRTALENDEFELNYQPIMDLKTNEVVGMESLIRWNNKMLGQVAPDEFISVAEETDMIVPIGHWVLETAIKQQIKWQNEGYQPLKISVNISVRQIIEPTFIDYVRNALENARVNPKYIVLEITESIAMYEDSMIEKLYALKELGINLSMDDFGTGYSSLSYLNKYPLDSLKIDKSFVIGMNKEKESKAIVKTIVAIAQQLNLKVIAEGIESKEDYHFLAEIGCDFGQGYHIDRPLPVSQVEKWLIAAR